MKTETNTETNGEYKIVKTSEYKDFKFLPGNRIINHMQVSKLKKSIEHNNLTSIRPIICNERMQIIDGQHTYLACKELAYPIFYITRPGGNIEDVRSLNSSTKNWNGSDYLYMWVQRGNKNYVVLNEFIERWRFNLRDSIRLLNATDNSEQRSSSQDFKDGNFVISDVNLANKWAEMIYDFSSYTDYFRNRSFVIACTKIFKLRQYKHKQMVSKLVAQGKKIPLKEGYREYLKELDRIYNLNEKNNYSLYLEVSK